MTNPSWREGFFSSLPSNISDARTPLEIFLSLKNTAAPPTTVELRSYLNFLVDRKFYDLAYYTWLQFLPAEQLNKVGNLFNGSFEFDPSGLPFDWVWTEKPGATIEIAAPPDREEERALSYRVWAWARRFLRHYSTDHVASRQLSVSRAGTKQTLSASGACSGGSPALVYEGVPIGESAMINGQDSSWQDFQFSFNVPDSDCPAQYVTLASGARSASEQFISGTIWCDDLKIVNESVVAPSKEPLYAI